MTITVGLRSTSSPGDVDRGDAEIWVTRPHVEAVVQPGGSTR
jgi:hypothetical protein